MHRLKTRPQFQATMAAGTIARTAHFALHCLALESPHPLFAPEGASLGALVPKRWARRAVTRNTIKRQIYTVGATFEARLPQAAHVVRLRTAFDRKQFVSATSDQLRQAVRAELLQLFGHAARRAGGAAASPAPAAAPQATVQVPAHEVAP